MDSSSQREMARRMGEVLNGLYAMRPQLVAPAAGSRGADDRVSSETRRNGDPWGTAPAETYTSLVAGLSVATVDHLHGCAQIMLDDVDFGPGVMARCTLEAAGRRLSRVLLKWGGDPSPCPAVLAGFGGPTKTLRKRGITDEEGTCRAGHDTAGCS